MHINQQLHNENIARLKAYEVQKTSEHIHMYVYRWSDQTKTQWQHQSTGQKLKYTRYTSVPEKERMEAVIQVCNNKKTSSTCTTK